MASVQSVNTIKLQIDGKNKTFTTTDSRASDIKKGAQLSIWLLRKTKEKIDEFLEEFGDLYTQEEAKEVAMVYLFNDDEYAEKVAQGVSDRFNNQFSPEEFLEGVSATTFIRFTQILQSGGIDREALTSRGEETQGFSKTKGRK